MQCSALATWGIPLAWAILQKQQQHFEHGVGGHLLHSEGVFRDTFSLYLLSSIDNHSLSTHIICQPPFGIYSYSFYIGGFLLSDINRSAAIGRNFFFLGDDEASID